MRSFFQKHKHKLLLVTVILLVLAAAYFFTEQPHRPSSSPDRQTASSSSAVMSAVSVPDTPDSSIPEVPSLPEEEMTRPEKTVSSPVSREEPSEEVPSVSQEEPSEEVSSISREEPSEEVSSMSREESSVQVSSVSREEPSVEVSSVSQEEPSVEVSSVSQEEPSVTVPSIPEVSLVSRTESSVAVSEEPSAPYTCRFAISCATLTDRVEELPQNKRFLVPEDGVLLAPCTVVIEEGESVFDVTRRICQERRIPFEFTMTPIYHTAYIEGLYNLYEFDCGSASGWVYTVNDVQPGVGCSDYAVHDGDTVIWHYTCALGNDITPP